MTQISEQGRKLIDTLITRLCNAGDSWGGARAVALDYAVMDKQALTDYIAQLEADRPKWCSMDSAPKDGTEELFQKPEAGQAHRAYTHAARVAMAAEEAEDRYAAMAVSEPRTSVEPHEGFGGDMLAVDFEELARAQAAHPAAGTTNASPASWRGNVTYPFPRPTPGSEREAKEMRRDAAITAIALIALLAFVLLGTWGSGW